MDRREGAGGIPAGRPMNILVLNAGSSTLKFQLIQTTPARAATARLRPLARGLIDRIGSRGSCTLTLAGRSPQREEASVRDHEEAVERVLSWLEERRDDLGGTVDAVGHRVVHGGLGFRNSVRLDEGTVEALEALGDLAPLHNPASVSGIRAARRILGPSVPMAAVFDTSFHSTLPEAAATYALPYEVARRHGIRRFGFHGLAHRYLALRYAQIRGISERRVNIVTLHLGNGCSASAIRGGRSVETSMGLTPLEGLVMGTRSGDLDPAVVRLLCEKEGWTVAEVEDLLNNGSGLLGLSGVSRDMRELIKRRRSDARCRLAVEVFCHRARKYLGAYLAVLGGADAVIFSGGIGENSAAVRARICNGLEWFGLRIDSKLNRKCVGTEGRISPGRCRLPVYVLPVDEEQVIARETERVVLSGG